MHVEKPSPFADARAGWSAARLGLWLFLLSLAMLFAATVVGFIVIRVVIAGGTHVDAPPWPNDLPDLPWLLWLSTTLLVISSVTVQMAVVAIRRAATQAATTALAATLGLGVVFLVLQALSWTMWHERAAPLIDASETHRFALSSFYVLTAVHAAHLIGGIIPLAVTASRAAAGRYDAHHHAGIDRCALYWHFLDGVWLGLFALMLVGL